MLNRSDKKAFDAVKDVGIAIRTFDGGQQVHIGMLHKIDTASALLLHFREHLDLKNETPSDSYCWMQIELEEINRRLLASLCVLIARQSSNIPYGFTYNGRYFDRTGNYIPQGMGHGLTCATFVMAIFNTYNIPLLQTSEWLPADLEDQLWQTKMVGRVNLKSGVTVADATAKYIGQPRFKPEHVAAGAVTTKRPLTRAAALKLSERILKDLKRAGK